MGVLGWLWQLPSLIGTLAASVHPCPGWGLWCLEDHQGPSSSDGV